MKDQIQMREGFWSYLRYIWKENRKLYLIGVLYFPAFIIANYLQIYLPKLVIMELEQKRSILHLGIRIFGLILILLVCIIVRVQMQSRLEIGNRIITKKMEDDYAQKLLYVDYECLEDKEFISMRNTVYKSFSAGGLGEVENAAVLTEFLPTLLLMIASFGNIFLYLFYLCKLTPWLIVLSFFIPLSVVLIRNSLVKQEVQYAKKNADSWKKLDYTVRKTEDFSMAKDVRLYQMSSWFSQLIDQYIKEGLVYKVKELKIRLLSGYINTIIFGIFNGCIFASLLYRLWHGNIVVSDLVFYAGMGPALFRLCSDDLTTNFMKASQQSIEFQRFQRFMHYGEDSGRLTVPIEKKAPNITLEHVSFAYPDTEREILQDLSLQIRAGEKIAIVGVNGAGKTTLMKLICGLLHPTKGRILLNGKDMEEMEAEERYAWFSCAFQDIQFLPLSIRENISMMESNGESKTEEKIWRCLEQAGIRQEIEALPDQLDSLMEKSIHETAVDFSGGQRQKLILARALYRDTGALILDEPTAALDALAENDIYEKYAEFAEGKTSFFVSHRLSSTRFCDRILLLDGGKIVEEGKHEELLEAGGLYSEMFQMQSKYYKEGVTA